MKKNLLLLIFLLPTLLVAQNLQIHYDFGENRKYITTTLEMLKFDKLGNTFAFVDFDYNYDDDKNVSMAYMEIARCFTLSKKVPISAQIEFNGGFGGGEGFSYPINNAFLAGLDYGFASSDFTKFFNIKVLYKYITGEGKNPLSYQLTAVWDLDFFNNKLTLAGFADFWRENNTNYYDRSGNALVTPTNTKFVFLAEPQVWYNVTKNFSVGSEVEVASNFGTIDGLKVCPTLAVKWTFD